MQEPIWHWERPSGPWWAGSWGAWSCLQPGSWWPEERT